MMSISTTEVSGNGTPATISGILNRLTGNKRNSLVPGNVTGKRSQPTAAAPVESVQEPDEPDTFDSEESEERLKERFQNVLIAHCKATIPLTEAVAELIAADIDRDTAIDWGIETGLNEGYVRSTVSSLYIELTGERKKKAGGGRKANKGALALALRVMKESDDDVDKAKALLLAARRLI